MKKFIVLSFGFLGWIFYEMSGGADFVPASALVAPVTETEIAVVPAEQPAPPVEADEDPAEATRTSFVDTDPPLKPLPEPASGVTRVSLNLTTLQGVMAEETAPQDDGTGVPVNPGYSVSSADTPAIIPSLVVGAGAGAATEPVVTSVQSDIRTVSGNRVNVRGGPGTDFGVVSRLVRGDEVEVLQDDGNGWVLMRPLDGDVEGWMADFLLTSG